MFSAQKACPSYLLIIHKVSTGLMCDFPILSEIVDADGGQWVADAGTACDLSSYLYTECEVYGFSSGGTSSVHNRPLINMNHDDNRIVFCDGKEL